MNEDEPDACFDCGAVIEHWDVHLAFHARLIRLEREVERAVMWTRPIA